MQISAGLAHLIGGIVGIGAFTALAATGTITGQDALLGIGPIIGVLLGTSATSIGAAQTSSTTTPSPIPTTTGAQS